MSLSIVRPLIKLPTSVNTISALGRTITSRRNFSNTTPNQFLFSKKLNNVEFEKVQIPNSNFKMGTPQPVPKGKSIELEPKNVNNLLGFFLGALPSSVSLISSISPEGIPNAAPFALCNCISYNPPVLCLTVGKNPDGSVKDTQVNIDANNEFAVNVVSKWFFESTLSAAAPFPHEISEFDKVGFTKKNSSVIKTPLVDQSAVSFECKVISRNAFTDKNGTETAVAYNGEVVKIHVNDEVYDVKSGNFNYDNLKLMLSLGDHYSKINNIIDIKYSN